MPDRAIQLVLFDLDGTLADTAQDLARALNETLEANGRPALPFAAIRPHVSNGASALVRFGFRMEPDEPGFDALRLALIDHYQRDIAAATRLFPGMDELLEALERRGVPWGVVTNKPAYLTEPLMAALGLAGRAACIVSGDSTPTPKPDPAPIHLACTIAGIAAAHSLYVGDAARDIEAGRNAGALTLAALFGYLGEGDVPQEWGADGYIQHPIEVLDWV